jgi:nucleotide-binding universal stress UspA family protein
MFRKLLVPLDGTDAAARALPYAVELARRFDAALVLVDVVPTRDTTLALAADIASGAMTDPALIAAEVSARETAARGYITAVAEELAAQGVQVAAVVAQGAEGRGVVDVARREGVDLIVMAAHGHGPLGRLVFGNVTEDVIHHSPAPVLVIPPRRGAERST